jgi:tetratricopeptide (TPR) repeat protein
MRLPRPNKTRELFAPIAVASLAVLLSACHSGPKSTDARRGQAGRRTEYLTDLVFRDALHGVKWVIPAKTQARFETNPNYNAVITVGNYGASFLSIAYTGDAAPDDYATACAMIRGFNVEYPSAGVRKLPSTESNGSLWQHYIFEGTNDNGPFRIIFDITRRGSIVVGLVNFSSLKGASANSNWDDASVYAGLSFTDPNPLAKLTKEEASAYGTAASRILQQISNSYFDRKRPTEAIPFIRQAEILRPEDSAIATVHADALILSHDYAKILPEIDALCSRFPNESNLVWRRAYVYGFIGRKDDALKEYARAIHEQHNTTTDALNSYLSYLDSIHELGPRLNEVIALCNLSGDPMIQLYKARASIDSGDKTRVSGIIDDLVQKCEAYPQLAEPLVSLYLDMKNYEDALRISEKIIAQGNPAGHYLAAATLLREGRFKEARTHVLISLEKLPNNRNVKELSDAINAQLGKADTSAFQTPIEAIALPEEFKSLIPAAPAGFEDGFGSHNEYMGVMYDFAKGRPLRTTLYGRFHVGNVNAMRKMNDLRFPFDPLYERIFINYVRVYDAANNQIAEGKLSDCYTANDSNQVLMSQKKELHVPVPSLSPGCTVEYAASFQTLGNQDKMPFKLRRLSQPIPTLLSFVGVRGDAEAIASSLVNGVQELEGNDSCRFFYSTLPEALTLYPDTPPGTMYIPSVWLGSKEKTWAGETKYYFDMAGKLLDADPAATEKARQILGAKFTKDEAVEKLTDYVRKSLTYQGLAFGVRAMVPNSCEDILLNRYGDCKDHSYLLVQLLRSAGIKAYLALVDTTRDINTSIPDVGQFDHMIVYLPDYKGGWFIDTTDKVNSSHYQPFWLINCPCLILDPENARLVPISSNPPNASGLDITRTVTISSDGRESIHENVVFRGLWAGYMRNILQDKTPQEYAPAISNAIPSQSIAYVRSITATNLDDTDKDLILDYTYSPLETFILNETGMTGRIPASWDADAMTPLNDQQIRRIPIWQSHEYTISAETTLILPKGYTPGNTTRPAEIRNDTPFITFESSLTQEASRIKLTDKCHKFAGVFLPDTRDDRDAAYRLAAEEIHRPIVLVKQP